MPILPLIKSLLNKNAVIGGLSIIILLILVQYKRLDAQFKTARLVYENPATKETVRTIQVQGPVRIITKVVERPSETIKVIEETRGAITEISEIKNESAPIPESLTMAKPRTDRWLLTIGANRLSNDFDGKAVFIGYGFKNRLDVQIGGSKRDEFSPWALATFRF